MKVPLFTRQSFVDKDGNLTPAIQQVFDVLFQQMQQNLSNDGMVIPGLNTNDINQAASPSNTNNKPNGTLWYDTTTNELKLKKNDTVVVIA